MGSLTDTQYPYYGWDKEQGWIVYFTRPNYGLCIVDNSINHIIYGASCVGHWLEGIHEYNYKLISEKHEDFEQLEKRRKILMLC